MVAPQEFWQGVEEFNQQQFYACHDTLEAIWIEAPETDKRFYQGILQVAVGCYHMSNGNWRGAVILLGEAVRRLCDYQPTYHGVDVELLLQQANQLLQTLQKIEPEQVTVFFQQLQENSQILEQKEQISATQPSDYETRFDQADRNLINNCRLPKIVMVGG